MIDSKSETTMTPDQLERARDLGPQMAEVLAGWICCEGGLAATQIGFRERFEAAKRMRKIYRDANRLVQQVLGIE